MLSHAVVCMIIYLKPLLFCYHTSVSLTISLLYPVWFILFYFILNSGLTCIWNTDLNVTSWLNKVLLWELTLKKNIWQFRGNSTTLWCFKLHWSPSSSHPNQQREPSDPEITAVRITALERDRSVRRHPQLNPRCAAHRQHQLNYLVISVLNERFSAQ